MSNEKLEVSYKFPKLERKNSIFINSGATYSPYVRPHSGYSTDSRFFAKNGTNDPQYLVKRILQQKIEFSGDTPEKRSKLFAVAEKEFERELEKWNIVYPNKKGAIVLNQQYGPRLILPYLPGQELGWWLNNIKYNDKLTEAKIWLAVAYALRDLATKNLYQNDILGPNILVHDEGNGLFKAYVIDFGGVGRFDCNIGRNTICTKAESLTGYVCKNYDEAISNLNTYIASFTLPNPSNGS